MDDLPPQEPPDDDDDEITSLRRLKGQTVDDTDATVLAFRNRIGEPIVVPKAVATAADRAYRCYTRRIAGDAWSKIAMDEGYASASAAKYDVDRYLEEGRALIIERSVTEALILEVSRLDMIQAAVWPSAMAGHIPSASEARQIIMSRAKLIGLDPDKINEDLSAGSHTVVVPTNSVDYIARLKEIDAGDQPPPPPA